MDKANQDQSLAATNTDSNERKFTLENSLLSPSQLGPKAVVRRTDKRKKLPLERDSKSSIELAKSEIDGLVAG